MDFKFITTLSIIVRDNNEILLTYKKRGFGQGKWNAPGGKVEPGEKPIDSAIREVKEETDIDIKNIEELGSIEFIWPKNLAQYNTRTHIFLAKEFSGEEQECEECRPVWFKLDQILYGQMWDDDKYWYPEALAGKMLKKRFYYGADEKVISFKDI